MKNLPLSYVAISKDNLIDNIRQFRGLIDKKTKIAAVVKANAYGHGDKEVVKILGKYSDYFQVNSIEELKGIRSFTKKEILVLGYVSKNDIEKVMELRGTLCIFDLEHALIINQVARTNGKKQKVHIAIDSCLGREGVMPDNLESFISEISKMKNLSVEGIYSHFANIEDSADFSHAQKQIDLYANAVILFKKYNFKNIKTHISATSGILAYEKDKGLHTIVRLGIGLYGMWPSPQLEKKWRNKIKLAPVMTWVTAVAQVKILPKGHSVGYGLTYITKKETTIAVIPQGYSNGLDRKLSNNGEVLICGKRAPIIGRVAMNMFVVDVSYIPDIKAGDEVVILGSQGKEIIYAEDIAREADTINYEVTTRISPLLPRIVQ